jgi:hypothetical protein
MSKVKIGGRMVEQATTSKWYKCDHCEHLHVMFCNELGDVYAVAVIDQEMVDDTVKVISGPPTFTEVH